MQKTFFFLWTKLFYVFGRCGLYQMFLMNLFVVWLYEECMRQRHIRIILQGTRRKHSVERCVADALRVSPSLLSQYREYVRDHQIRRVEKAFADERSEKSSYGFASLLQWALGVGVVMSPLVELRTTSRLGFGLFATRRIPAGHSVMSLPTYVAFESSPMDQEGHHSIAHASIEVAQRLYDSPETAYKAFLRALPLPRNAPFLNDSDLGTAVGRQRLAELRGLERFNSLPPWVIAHTLSRTHQRDNRICLFPMIDLLNHHNDVTTPNCHYEIVPGNSAALVDNAVAGVPTPLLRREYMHMCTVREAAAGEELLYTYAAFDGSDIDRDMFRLYGGFELCEGKSADVDDTIARAAQAVEMWLEHFGEKVPELLVI